MSTSKLRAGTPLRTLPNVLRLALSERDVVRLDLGAVVAIPDAVHVTVSIGGDELTVPRLSSYITPVVGEPVYLLFGGLWAIALGTTGPNPG